MFFDFLGSSDLCWYNSQIGAFLEKDNSILVLTSEEETSAKKLIDGSFKKVDIVNHNSVFSREYDDNYDVVITYKFLSKFSPSYIREMMRIICDIYNKYMFNIEFIGNNEIISGVDRGKVFDNTVVWAQHFKNIYSSLGQKYYIIDVPKKHQAHDTNCFLVITK